jgi:hypothetical protein
MNKSCMCKRNEESINHLLLHCDVASTIWSSFSVILGCPGFCLDVLLICMTVGGLLAGQGVLRCGKLWLHATFGAYRGK